VQSSFDRLVLQVWPSFVLVFFVLLRRLADPAPAAVVKSAVTRKSPVHLAKPAPAGKKVK
jgi:hypothetical protein